MFVHAVYFWLNENLPEPDRRAFEEGVRSLTTIETVEHAYTGVPAATDRPVIERGYSYALIAVFPDEAAHDAYQEHPTHDTFRRECARFWRKVLIFDSVG